MSSSEAFLLCITGLFHNNLLTTNQRRFSINKSFLGVCRNGTWNLGGLCDADREPESDMKKMEPDPIHNNYISEVIQEMRYEHSSKVKFLNITYLTEFRKDAHPSRYREPGTPEDAPQDCSHWCLPGVPDTWNEILYAQLLAMNYRTK